MAKTFTAPFAQAPKHGRAICTTAVTGLDATNPANTVKLATAGAEGALLTRLTAMPRATVTATNLLLWSSLDGGTTKHLKGSLLMAAHTVATTTAIPITAFTRYTEAEPLRMQAAEELYVGISVDLAGGIVFTAETTDY